MSPTEPSSRNGSSHPEPNPGSHSHATRIGLPSIEFSGGLPGTGNIVAADLEAPDTRSNADSAAPGAPADPSAVDVAILDAARACVAEFGVRRTTLTEVARRAGVSRPTVYRRWPDTGALIADLLVRELRDIVGHAIPTVGSARARLLDGIVIGADRIRTNPLFDKIFRTDTDLMLTYVFGRLGRNQRELILLFGAVIREGQRDGSIRDGDPEQLATMLLLIAQSAVQSGDMVRDILDEQHLDAELARAIDGYLIPDGAERLA
ncbi:hypothetical protein NRB56_20740 [Nocardia sp. RB56]|uniref:HTH tetR-type domain-containing protein n=1 Tax=Nocardia aurantia TaxID=2585199 RepID=A0A7K0DL43_9NOCA|nr:TetR/AcrR family transcriptional regulator [Nocardia aurantia]MQY26503.1 hypothetical protein [Nocardia aurantia]